MRFRNKDDDEVRVPSLGVTAAAAGAEDGADEFDVNPDKAATIALQCGDDGRFEPVDDEATALVASARADYQTWAVEYEASVAPVVGPDPEVPADESQPLPPAGDQGGAQQSAADQSPRGDEQQPATDDQQGSQS